MAKIFVLAVAAAFYPTLLAIVILFVFADSGAFDSSHHSVGPAVDLVIGLLSLALAVALATGYDSESRASSRVVQGSCQASGISAR